MRQFAFLLLVCFQAAQAAPLSTVYILRNHQKLQGQRVTVEGRAVSAEYRAKNVTADSFETMTSFAICTLMYCGESCCNSCGSSVSITDDLFGIALQGQYLGQEISCSGNECGLTCNPQAGKRYRATGILRFEDHGDAVRLWLESPILQPLP